MIETWTAELEAIAARADFWLTVSTVAAWLGFGLSIAAAVILIITMRREEQ